jgi:C1A family cysteine protease
MNTTRKFLSLDKLHAMRDHQKKLPRLAKFTPCRVSNASLKAHWPKIYDQGQIGSCTANAFCACFKFLNAKKDFEPSRLYVYYKERAMETSGQVTDSGAFVADGRKWANEHGVCAEYLWPYDVSKVNVAPPSQCDSDAYYHKSGPGYAIVDDKLNSVKACICSGEPVMMAFGVYASFQNVKSDGIAPVPSPNQYENYNDTKDAFEGGHEVAIIGFDDAKQLLTVANSWGDSWGDYGFFYMPYAFFNNTNLVYALDVLKPFETQMN